MEVLKTKNVVFIIFFSMILKSSYLYTVKTIFKLLGVNYDKKSMDIFLLNILFIILISNQYLFDVESANHARVDLFLYRRPY